MLGDTEVQNLHLPGLGEHDVFRLDIAVHDTALVSGV